MKKFLVFLTSIVVVVCFGLTTYYFMKNDEVITINTKEIYCNAGDIISLEELDIKVKKPHRKTTFNYNATEESSNAVSYNADGKFYEISSTAGGEVDLVITTTNKKYAEFVVKLHIGNGSVENPYYIFNQIGLSKIGTIYRLDSAYSLMANISLSNDFKPIGYSEASSSYIGFSGNFYGNGYTISGLNLNSADFANAGLFSSINAGALVKDLKVNNATINGSYTNAGVLAGTIAGTVEKIAITNSTITNTSSNSYTGALAGVYAGSSLKLSYADNVTLNIGANTATTEEVESEESEGAEEETNPIQTISNATVGGFVGKLIETTSSATYVNNATINLTNASGNFGGYAGEFVINTNAGSIQQSYANTACVNNNFAGFIGKITTAANFNMEESNMLTHLIGNIAVVNGKTTIADSDLVKSYNASYFKNYQNKDASVFFNSAASLYLIRGFASAGSVVETNEFVYYAIDANSKAFWDTTYVWSLSTTSMPTLIMGSVEPDGVSGEYFRKDLTQVEVTEKENDFTQVFDKDINDANIKLLEDVNLSSGWQPINISNTTIDGNGITITINLNKSTENNLGLFASVNNCTIKNLNIVVTGVSVNAINAGALAGVITSSKDTMSTIENVKVTYQSEIVGVEIANFGGIAGKIEKTVISNSTVEGLVVGNSSIQTIGSVVGELTSGSINNIKSTATINGTTNVGGAVGVNKGTISKLDASVNVSYNKTTANALVGGIVGKNDGTIIDSVANVNLNVTNANSSLYVGGVAATNNGTISLINISGDGISLSKINATIYVGGVVATNNGTIVSAYNYLKNIGAAHVGANYRVGGLASVNNGTISKSIVASNVNGNYAAGLVVDMKTSGSIDQVVIGNFNKQNKAISAISITGNKYVAGFVVDFRAGTISNIQANSNINGDASSTRTSLIALVFARGAKIANSTVNSKLSGYGEFYRETWTDYDYCDEKAEFGLYSSNGSSYFDIYKSSAYCGEMTSVVIKSDYANNVSVNESMAMVQNIMAIPAGNDYNGVNYVKVVSNFADFNEFAGNFTFNCAYNKLWNYYDTETKELKFAVGTVWENNNGISLIFLKDVK